MNGHKKCKWWEDFMPQVFWMCTNCSFGQQCHMVGGAVVLDNIDIVCVKYLSNSKLTLHIKIYEEDEAVTFYWLSWLLMLLTVSQ